MPAIRASESKNSCSCRQLLHLTFILYPGGMLVIASGAKRNPLSKSSPFVGHLNINAPSVLLATGNFLDQVHHAAAELGVPERRERLDECKAIR